MSCVSPPPDTHTHTTATVLRSVIFLGRYGRWKQQDLDTLVDLLASTIDLFVDLKS